MDLKEILNFTLLQMDSLSPLIKKHEDLQLTLDKKDVAKIQIDSLGLKIEGVINELGG